MDEVYLPAKQGGSLEDFISRIAIRIRDANDNLLEEAFAIHFFSRHGIAHGKYKIHRDPLVLEKMPFEVSGSPEDRTVLDARRS